MTIENFSTRNFVKLRKFNKRKRNLNDDFDAKVDEFILNVFDNETSKTISKKRNARDQTNFYKKKNFEKANDDDEKNIIIKQNVDEKENEVEKENDIDNQNNIYNNDELRYKFDIIEKNNNLKTQRVFSTITLFNDRFSNVFSNAKNM